ncbi:FliM/FliN family flagellar motor C-terminal domain-containing protein [Luteibacter jiangsuensis]
MAADRFGWLGATRRAALTAWVHAQLAAWWKDWSILAPVIESGGAAGTDASAWLKSGDAVAVGSPGASALAAALVGVGTDQAGALARYIGEEAMTDLVRRLCGSTEAAALETVEPGDLPRGLTEDRLGATHFRMAVCGFGLGIHLARSVADRVVPPSGPGAAALVGRRAAVGEAVSRLTVTLDLGDIALSELGGLRPGDVIVTQATLDAMPSLTVAGGSEPMPIARARLGERDGHRAVLLFHS